MKILNILSEDFTSNISRMALNSLELRTLNRLDKGVVDIETASKRELDTILVLVDMGLVDTDGNLTDGGREAILPLDTDVNLRDVGGGVDDTGLGDGTDDVIDDDDAINFNLDRELGRQ